MKLIIELDTESPTPKPLTIDNPEKEFFFASKVIVKGIVAELVLPNFFKDVGKIVFFKSNFFCIVSLINLLA